MSSRAPRFRMAYFYAFTYAVFAVFFLFGEFSLASFAAPILGPWAGALWGHLGCSCSLAEQNGLGYWSGALLILGFVAVKRFPTQPRRGFVCLFSGLTVIWWGFLALASLVNTLS